MANATEIDGQTVVVSSPSSGDLICYTGTEFVNAPLGSGMTLESGAHVAVNPGNGLGFASGALVVSVATLAGLGLTDDAGQFALAPGNGLAFSGSTIAVDAGTGLTFDGGGTLIVNSAANVQALSGSASLSELIDKVNELLTALETAGLMLT